MVSDIIYKLISAFLLRHSLLQTIYAKTFSFTSCFYFFFSFFFFFSFCLAVFMPFCLTVFLSYFSFFLPSSVFLSFCHPDLLSFFLSLIFGLFIFMLFCLPVFCLFVFLSYVLTFLSFSILRTYLYFFFYHSAFLLRRPLWPTSDRSVNFRSVGRHQAALLPAQRCSAGRRMRTAH